MPPKGILKMVDANAPPAPRANTQRERDVALHHAGVLEQRKAIEKQVLNAIIDLLDLPTSPRADPKRPSPADALQFRAAVTPFQPSDYDALIEERNIAGMCGYALCPRPKKKAPSTARKHFIDTDSGVQIVDRRVLEVWCGDDCARRALWVKVQLNEEPAWLRQGGVGAEMELLVDNKEDLAPKALPLRPKKEAAPAKEEDPADDVEAAFRMADGAMAELAVERGEAPGGLSRADNNTDLVADTIKERTSLMPPTAPKLVPGQSHMAIEGHVPRHNRVGGGDHDEDDEDEDNDWDLG